MAEARTGVLILNRWAEAQTTSNSPPSRRTGISIPLRATSPCTRSRWSRYARRSRWTLWHTWQYSHSRLGSIVLLIVFIFRTISLTAPSIKIEINFCLVYIVLFTILLTFIRQVYFYVDCNYLFRRIYLFISPP